MAAAGQWTLVMYISANHGHAESFFQFDCVFSELVPLPLMENVQRAVGSSKQDQQREDSV